MFIAFEGPDNTGKSTSSSYLDGKGSAVYNATKELHEEFREVEASEPEVPFVYDRIDWLTHMVYRLALPKHEWNDSRVRTVFAMPDTHLVFKIHEPRLAKNISDELYEDGKVALVNPVYYYMADFLMGLNRVREYSLFKTVSIIEVYNDVQAGTFSQRLREFDSPVTGLYPYSQVHGDITTDDQLLDLLRYEDENR